MGRRQDIHQHDATTVVNSSIALLQERFRQLEKVKERREGKELLKLFSSSSSSAAVHFQASPPPPQQQPPSLVHGSLSLGLNQPNRQARHHNTPSPSTFWPQQGASASNFDHYSDVDIDTSLHL
ncbi:hypothetical protein QN277_019320 [Acacia crassicarpa]|uniref:Uncharacterized protein n=1 Tax=Acacia crassicarpa TaxID=499986 RepID=A0AAE1JVG0_9FABA|nr:hypothetical protein QN277_019320 [Acacia crassicarpa]